MGGTGGFIEAGEVAMRVGAIRARIAEVGDSTVAIVAVTKSFGVDAIRAAHAAGCDGIGENYAQELMSKAPSIPAGMPVHFIGRLQSNKVRALAPIVDLWQSVDRVSLVDEIARRAHEPPARVLLQVNTTGESSKGGCEPGQVNGLLERAQTAGVVVEGLMTVGPTGGTPAESAAAFGLLRRLADDLGLRHCSMGMSDDWEIAVEKGATILRLGSALFGPRSQ